MYETLTYERIMSRVLSNVPSNVDKREGSVIYDAVAPVCSEIAQIYVALDNCLRESFADTAQRDYLILRAKEIGIEPKKATNAILRGEIEGVVDIGDRFALDDLRYTVTEKISNGVYKLKCDTAGSVGNTKFGTLIPVVYNPYITSATLTALITEGQDEEATEDFRARYFENIGRKGYGGNRADYINWAKAISGVGQARAVRAYNGGGTVKVIILDSNNGVPSSELCNTVKEKLDPVESTGCGKGIAPIGHRVNVVGAVAKNPTINIKVSLANGYSKANVAEEVKNAVLSYFAELNAKFSSTDNITISSLQIISRVCNIEGITTIASLNIEGQYNMILAEDEICGSPIINMEV